MHERLLGGFAICTGRVPNELHGSKAPTRWTCELPDVPFLPTTSESRAITFKGFLTTLTLSREEVVTIRGPINCAQPPFTCFPHTGFHSFLPNFLSHFRVHLGFGTLGAAHGHLDPSLRSPTSPTSHRAVPGARVPSRSPETSRGCLLSGCSTRDPKLSLATLVAASPTLSLVH
ncbi:hypothetical protein CRG98_042714 [Punica granatum]|uniref:Uncharacterized protein n=1 Tax=Punica granatum TaxID=22663 RepID=A0A2I0HYW4_PUNGR|nr:hypothetical protein CRG98_042714 [Punica granatum]